MASIYYYTARNAEGAFVRGAIEAATHGTALASLRTRALFVTSLAAAGSTRGIMASAIHLGPVKHSSLVTFFRSFATLISAGVTLRRALQVTIEQCADARLREALRAILCDIEGGVSLSEAISRRPKEFSKLFVAMIRAGEVGGVLDEVLERLATFMERDRTTRKRLTSALTYPGIVAATAAVLIVFLLSSIVPMFASLYDQMHVELPASTTFLLALGNNLRNVPFWLLGAASALTSGICAVKLLRTKRGRLFLDSHKLRIPIFGSLMRKSALARFARMLGSLLKSGVGLVLALEVVADVVGNAAYEHSITGVRQALREGDPLADPLAASGLYDSLVIQMVRVGEETGSLDGMLLRIAEYYEVDVETALNTLGSTLEPVLIAGLGGVVGFIVFSIFIPLYTLIGSIK
ncbi:MAG: type II secretion system F family protein [Candidatus Eremiobacteraeota bacterium]|nr:type II secretion system F family protein [Candidatus Eremiobacteraeota bacterium]